MRSISQTRAALQSLPIITFTATSLGIIDWVSDRWYEATGIPSNAVHGEAWVQIIHPDDIEHVVWLWTRALDEGTPWEATPRVRHADGTYRWWFTRAERVETEDDGWLWIGTTVELTTAALDAIQEVRSETPDDADILA